MVSFIREIMILASLSQQLTPSWSGRFCSPLPTVIIRYSKGTFGDRQDYRPGDTHTHQYSGWVFNRDFRLRIFPRLYVSVSFYRTPLGPGTMGWYKMIKFTSWTTCRVRALWFRTPGRPALHCILSVLAAAAAPGSDVCLRTAALPPEFMGHV